MDICFPHHFAAPSLLENERCNDAVIGCLPPTQIFLQGVIESFNLWLSPETLLSRQAKAASSSPRQFVERGSITNTCSIHAMLQSGSAALPLLLLSLMMTIAAKMSLCHLPAFHTHCELLLLSSIIKPCGSSSSTDSFLISNSNKKWLHTVARFVSILIFSLLELSNPTHDLCSDFGRHFYELEFPRSLDF